ncbi:MAG TPA: hypothetical protein VK911_10105 [Vicinamibacterales bacterium]|nr:hypothetical protein [Vicinamibacterales bacterium]
MSKPMLLLEACCPNCDALLTEGQQVHLEAYCKEINQDGALFLSAVFGDQTVTTELPIPKGTAVELRCPVCDASLMLQMPCRLCGARLASVNLKTGGCLEFCSRAGCRGHALGGFGDVDEMMALLNTMLSTPHD